MELSENGFWARVYRASRRICFQFVDQHDFRGGEQTNLCVFVRTIFVWAPLIIALNIAAVSFAVYSAGSLLYVLWFHLSAVGGITLTLVIIGAIVAGLVYAHDMSMNLAKSETAKLAGEYLRAKKSKICPLIQIRGGDHASA